MADEEMRMDTRETGEIESRDILPEPEMMDSQFKLIESMNAVDETELCGGKAKLILLKSTYGKLKHSMLEGMSKLTFLENFYSNTWPQTSQADVELKVAISDLRSVKEESRELRESLQSLTQKAQTILEDYHRMTNTFIEKIQQFKEKKRRFEEQSKIQTRLQSLMKSKHGICSDMQKAMQQRESQLEEVRHLISDTEKKIAHLLSDIEELRHVNEDTAAELNERNLMAEKMRAKWMDKQQQDKQLIQWFDDLKQTLEALTGISEYKMDTKKKQILVLFASESEAADSGFQLTLTYKAGPYSRLVIHKAQVNMDFAGADEIIQKAVKDNDIVFLIHQLSSLWYRKRSLVESIESLRKRYAIDWLQAENRVRVMLGAGGRIMCDLSLPDDGNDTEHIKLLSVEGTTSPVDICQIKPHQERASLSQWLDFLHQYFTDNTC